MTIYWCGGNCVRIETQKGSLILDPASAANGAKQLKLDAAAVVFMSQEEKEKLSSPKDGFFPIYGPGEYDVSGVFVVGLNNAPDNSIYMIEAEGIRLCHISQISKKELTDEQLSDIGAVDILMIAADDGIDGETAAKIVNEIEPRLVVPMNFSGEKPSQFLKEMGVSAIELQNKLSVKKKDLPQEETKVVVLSPAK